MILEELKKYPKIPLGRANDLTGQKFGRLTALYRTENKSGKTCWVCVCDCKKEVVVSNINLISRHTRSCGCYRVEKNHYQFFKDLTGKKFGRLTVIKLINSRTPFKYECQCECGKIVNVKGTNLTSGNTSSCGCYNRDRTSETNYISLVGQRFGKLIVLERAEDYIHPNQKNRIVQYKCRCECGNIAIIRGANLKTNNTLSCGCLRSKGEEKIAQILRSNNIKFETQKTFPTCKDIRSLPFDFYLPKQNLLIEYDGEQHFSPQCFNGISDFNAQENFKKIQKHDQYKNKWSRENNIPLIRIPYTHYENLCLEDLLPESSNFIV